METVSHPRIAITLTKGPSTTIAVLEMLDECGLTVQTVVGEAKRHPRDQEDRHIGDMYALGRAFGELSNDMITWADQEVEHADTFNSAQTVGTIFRDLLELSIRNGNDF